MKQKRSGPDKSKPPLSKPISELYKVIPTPAFLKEASKLQKKYPNIHRDFLELAEKLKIDPTSGNKHITKDLWKVRMMISDKASGESGAARVIIEVKVIDSEVYVLSVYDKSYIEDLTEKELKKLMDADKPTPLAKKNKGKNKKS
ncbi:MAG: hypothetical protein EOO15_05220 [Chitinophagaceae bacterium]|nr:MAG: hypothetical protein EOO15_05220 [Chitinophagaceae bacterium]